MPFLSASSGGRFTENIAHDSKKQHGENVLIETEAICNKLQMTAFCYISFNYGSPRRTDFL